MNKIIYVSILFLLFCGCETNEIIIPNVENSKLIIDWRHEDYGNVSSARDGAMLYLYDSEEEYNNPIGKPILSQSLADTRVDHVVAPTKYVTFYNLDPEKYWVKIFNAYKGGHSVEFNSDSACTFQLIKNTNTTVTLRTKRFFVNSCTIKKIEIYDTPSWLNINNGDKVTVKIFEDFPISYGSEEDKVLDSQDVTVNSSSIICEPTNIIISRFGSAGFHPNYYVVLNKVGSSSEIYYKIDIFELLRSNRHFKNEYIKLNDQNEIEYKLYVTWDVD